MPDHKKINVLYLASEADPIIKVGGLGDVAGSLPKALRKLSPAKLGGQSLDVRLVLPFHSVITQKFDNFQLVSSFTVPHPNGGIGSRAFLSYIGDLPVYLIEGYSLLTAPTVYSKDNLRDTRKYTYFSLAVLEFVKSINWHVDILHANDWHTALSVYDLKLRRQQEPFFSNTYSILSMHNMPYMGAESKKVIHDFGLLTCECDHLPDWARTIPLPIGMYAADQLLTVSPNYAKEILTPEYGCGLQDFLVSRKESVAGILNGIDTDDWNPKTDAALLFRYDEDTLETRSLNKTALQDEFSLEKDPQIPLIVLVSRMDQQKGIDIAIEGLRISSNLNFQAIFLGTGDPILEAACRSLEVEFPDRVRAAIRFDLNLSRRMYAGGDLLLIPSRYEPCGLTQMIGMHYGCVPLARATGGLKDTIIDSKNENKNTGFLFNAATPEAFAHTLLRAITIFKDQQKWNQLQKNGMQSDFSWEKSALKYAHLYMDLTGGKNEN
ncbi:MAG: hypothetical protein BGO78_16365 [Chloroflexi bacterium 44-23]|nr:MAG: hypothetical protein BGO78_16365 [Chloroflexi bacterium 44-23]